jgi:hypothetical protein
LLLKGRPFGLIYADMANAGRHWHWMKKNWPCCARLRNQAVMAFKQSV